MHILDNLTFCYAVEVFLLFGIRRNDKDQKALYLVCKVVLFR
jgi:hypothetical protein